jgi:hypothetical protein
VEERGRGRWRRGDRWIGVEREIEGEGKEPKAHQSLIRTQLKHQKNIIKTSSYERHQNIT